MEKKFNSLLEKYPLWSEISLKKHIRVNGVIFKKLKDSSVGITYKKGDEVRSIIIPSFKDYQSVILKIAIEQAYKDGGET